MNFYPFSNTTPVWKIIWLLLIFSGTLTIPKLLCVECSPFLIFSSLHSVKGFFSHYPFQRPSLTSCEQCISSIDLFCPLCWTLISESEAKLDLGTKRKWTNPVSEPLSLMKVFSVDFTVNVHLFTFIYGQPCFPLMLIIMFNCWFLNVDF